MKGVKKQNQKLTDAILEDVFFDFSKCPGPIALEFSTDRLHRLAGCMPELSIDKI